MAEVGNGTPNLLQDVLNTKIDPRNVTAESIDVNNVDDLNVNKHSKSDSKLKSTGSAQSNDNSSTSLTNPAAEASVLNSTQGSVIRNNENEIKKTGPLSKKSSIKKYKVSDTSKKDTAFINGSANSVIKPESQMAESLRRGISFPKDTFISGYHEPPDPWKNAQSWTTDELITEYKKSCELHGAKPLVKVLQQLHTISTPGKREELLSLKGEKLDQKQCESLEEILRRVQFKLLDLEASHLDDECASALFDMIEYYESACQLNISFNKNIGARGWQSCSRLVRRTPTLTYLDMRNCDLNDRTIPIFGRALKLGCHLTILHMENMNLTGRPLMILVAALKMNETLQELFLADNKLMPTDGVQLGNLLRYNHKLSLLDLRNNHLQESGTNQICEGLMEQSMSQGLRTLVLWNNQVNYQAMPALGRALASTESLETLNIGHNSITNEGVHLLKEGLLKTNSLLRLGLQGTRISDEGSVALAEYIADSIILLRIDLRDNEIKTGGLMALSHAMRVNTSVTRIDLDKDPKKESGMKDYAEQQNRLLRDILTFQQRNVQTAMEREEQERAKLEERAEAAAAIRKKEEESKEEASASANAESFTVIDAEEIVDSNLGLEKDQKDAENSKLKMEVDKNEDNDSSKDKVLCDVEGEEDTIVQEDVTKLHHRPSHLFPSHILHPQEALDSPLPTTNENPLISVASAPENVPLTPPKLSSTAEKDRVCLDVGAPPAEVILSPQYFPKQIARKIFSVSRVDENGDSPCSSLSSSPVPTHPLSAVFDPLNVSPVPLVSSSSFTSSPPSSTFQTTPQSTMNVSQNTDCKSSATVSPSARLFQNLADESVKHMLSPDIDMDVKSLLANTSDSSNNVQDTKDNTDLTKDIETGAVCFPSELPNSEAQSSYSGDSKNFVPFDKNNCDISESPLSASRDSPVSQLESQKGSSTADMGDDNSVVSICANEGENLSSEQETSTKPDNDNQSGIPSNETEEPLSVGTECDENDNEGQNFIDRQENKFQNDVPGALVSENDPMQFETSETTGSESKYVNLLDDAYTSKSIGPPPNSMNNELSQPLHSHQGAGDDLLQSKESLEKLGHETLAKEIPLKETKFTHSKEGLEKESQAEPSIDIQKEESLLDNSTQSDSESQDSQWLSTSLFNQIDSACLNTSNSNSPSLLSSIDPDDLVSLNLVKRAEMSHTSTESNVAEGKFSSEDSLGLHSADSLTQSMQSGTNKTPERKADTDKTGESTTDNVLSRQSNPANDIIDAENVELSMDEEPWLAVGGDVDSNDTEKTKETSKQPDFFTTLSMNGLTQELASALTSLDGTTTGSGEEDDDLDS